MGPEMCHRRRAAAVGVGTKDRRRDCRPRPRRARAVVAHRVPSLLTSFKLLRARQTDQLSERRKAFGGPLSRSGCQWITFRVHDDERSTSRDLPVSCANVKGAGAGPARGGGGGGVRASLWARSGRYSQTWPEETKSLRWSFI
ncbi:hypothetical protein EVAR_56939_1 [Eumeta japonica]|uniref:Uncharacterized protein n=1 Tax=Eumeta variegata TaxID=151549 RepID=A0A4C1YEJ4_EUMVA|nr:hypothetical protein EVAR_56939_1 [Eumeta japonica]